MSGGLDFTLPPELLDALAERLAERIAERLPDLTAEHAAVKNHPAPWLDVEHAARYLTCEDHRIYDLVYQGRLRVARDGRRLLFRREWLDDCLCEDSTEG